MPRAKSPLPQGPSRPFLPELTVTSRRTAGKGKSRGSAPRMAGVGRRWCDSAEGSRKEKCLDGKTPFCQPVLNMLQFQFISPQWQCPGLQGRRAMSHPAFCS